ncbi:MAG: SMP-30/gluconolactonase/LRE family protein, partial [Gammaproteobacteria bacterium]|nr:SMP-30/gluconolactonase/LRE family protein [Gammaproteobacteria bacterium]
MKPSYIKIQVYERRAMGRAIAIIAAAVLASAFLITALHPPVYAADEPQRINNSFIAFTIPEKDLLPENVAYDPKEKAFYVGSTRKGKVLRVDKFGDIHDFVLPRQDGLWMIIGMKVDAERRVLWVNSSGGGNLIGYDGSRGRPAGIFKFDLKTGKLIRKYVLHEAGVEHFFNDLVLAPNGDVYATHMFDESAIYRISKSTGELSRYFGPEENFSFPNGITISDNGRRLYVAHREGISLIDIDTGERQLLSHPNLPAPTGIDGLYYYKSSLVGVHDDKVVQYFLAGSAGNIESTAVLELNHPMFRRPTTGVVVGDE